MNKVLTIAGSDGSGGAGIQADLKTITCLGCYGSSAITALTAQNTLGVKGIAMTEPEFFETQLRCILEDIFPDAIKIGMIGTTEILERIVRVLKEYPIRHLVVDPVMVSTSGSLLIAESAIACMKDELFPMAEIITPNLMEAEKLTGRKILSEEDMIEAGCQLYKEYGCAVLMKGGHFDGNANDILAAEEVHIYRQNRIDNPNTHGTGCTLSSAIASFLARGEELPRAVEDAKAYITDCLKAGLDLGAGSGPLMHNCKILDYDMQFNK